MKIRLIQALAFTFLLHSAVFAEETVVGQPMQDNSPCLNFPMPVIKPLVDEYKLPIVKPNSKIDYKLIIVNPCISKTEQLANPSVTVVTNNTNNLQSPAPDLKFYGSGFTLTPKDGVKQN